MAALESRAFSFLLSADDAKMQLLATCLSFVAALLVAALVIALVKRWQRRRAADEDCSPSAQLAHYRALYEAGTLSAEEFERLRTVLGGRIRASLGVPAPSAKPPQQAPPSPPTPPTNSDTGIRPA